MSGFFCIACICLFLFVHQSIAMSPIFKGKAVMLRVAEDIPKLKTRTQKSGGGDQTVQVGEGSKKSRKKKK